MFLDQGRTCALVLLAALLIGGFIAPSGGPGGSSDAAGSGDVVGTPTPLRKVPRDISTVANGELIV
jgi:hypothetical protein